MKDFKATDLAPGRRRGVRRAGIYPRPSRKDHGNVVSAGGARRGPPGGLAVGSRTMSPRDAQQDADRDSRRWMAAQSIGSGHGDRGRGGMESMSSPYLLDRAREGLEGARQVTDSRSRRALVLVRGMTHGQRARPSRGTITSPSVTDLAGNVIARVGGHSRRTIAAEICGHGPQKKGGDLIRCDESVRRTRPCRRRRGRPAFKKDGTGHAGNAPPVNDGAAA